MQRAHCIQLLQGERGGACNWGRMRQGCVGSMGLFEFGPEGYLFIFFFIQASFSRFPPAQESILKQHTNTYHVLLALDRFQLFRLQVTTENVSILLF